MHLAMASFFPVYPVPGIILVNQEKHGKMRFRMKNGEFFLHCSNLTKQMNENAPTFIKTFQSEAIVTLVSGN